MTRPAQRVMACIRAALGGIVALFLLAATPSGVSADDAARPTYRIGIYANAPKIWVDDAGNARGFYADIIPALARKSGFAFTYVPCRWADCLDMLERGDLDIMPDVAWSEERDTRFHFGHEAVLHGWSSLYSRPGLRIDNLFDLGGLRIAVLKDSIQAIRLKALISRYENLPTIMLTRSHRDTLRAVEAGTADVGIVNQFFGLEHDAGFNIVRTPIAFEPSPVFFAFSKRLPLDVLYKVDAALSNLKGDPDSLFYESKARWLDAKLPWQFPRWGIWVAVGLLGVLGLSIAGNAYLRRRVARATASLRESESVLNSVFENVPVALLIKDTDHRVVRPNNTYLKWYGLTLEDMMGRRTDEVEDFQAPADASEMVAQEDDVLRTGQPRTRIVRRPFADGREHTVSITKFPVYDGSGSISKIGSVSVDMTEQIAARRALAANEERFRDFAVSASDWLWETDRDHRFTYFSEHEGDTSTFNPAMLAGMSFADLAAGAVTGRDATRHGEALAARAAFRNCRYQFFDDGARAIISLSGKPVFDEDGAFRGYRGTGADITSQILAQEARTAALHEAERASKAKSEFLAIMSHDLRTPLNAILGFSDIIEHQYFGPVADKYREYARDILSSGRVLLSLVNEILDLSAIESGKRALDLAPVSLKELVAECEMVLSPRAQQGSVMLRTAVEGDRETITADRRALRQVLLNLLSNAVKFTPEGGGASLTATARESETVFAVCDTGCGMAPERIEKLMEPFVQGEQDPYRTKDGWGLGLAIAKSLVDLHGGTITVDSTVGQGTCVTVTLPA